MEPPELPAALAAPASSRTCPGAVAALPLRTTTFPEASTMPSPLSPPEDRIIDPVKGLSAVPRFKSPLAKAWLAPVSKVRAPPVADKEKPAFSLIEPPVASRDSPPEMEMSPPDPAPP